MTRTLKAEKLCVPFEAHQVLLDDFTVKYKTEFVSEFAAYDYYQAARAVNECKIPSLSPAGVSGWLAKKITFYACKIQISLALERYSVNNQNSNRDNIIEMLNNAKKTFKIDRSNASSFEDAREACFKVYTEIMAVIKLHAPELTGALDKEFVDMFPKNIFEYSVDKSKWEKRI